MRTRIAIYPLLAFLMRNAVLSVALLLVSGGCSQQTGREGEFEYTAEMWSAELTGVVEDGGDSAGAPEAGAGQERLVVPSRLGGKRVKSVGPGAFRNTDAVSVKIPWRVSRIGAGAFEGCTNLLWAELPSRLERVEEGLFRGCSRMEESDIPERVAEIGAFAYEGCIRLERVALPAKLRMMEKYAFSGCSMLASAEVPKGIANIPEGAFEGCRGLKSVRIPSGVTNIGARAFAGCESLERIHFPEGVREIGAGAFAGCGLLEAVTLPGSVERVGEGAFVGCGRLQTVEVAEGNPVFFTRDGVLFRDGGTELVFHPCTRGGRYAVPEGVRAIGGGAFAGCGLLETVTLPGSVERVGEGAFAGCGELRAVEVAEGNPVFSGLDGVLFRDGGAELVLYPCAKVGKYTVPAGVERIAPGAFRGSRVEKVTLPEGVRELGEAAFTGCSTLWEFTVPDGVERAGKDLFAECSGLMLLVVPDHLWPERESWQVPDGCTVYSRSAWEEEMQGRRPGRAIAPFFGLYAGEDLDTVTFEGTVLATSAVPDPDRNDYNDCLCALLVELDSVLPTTTASADVERVVLVNVPVMEDRSILRQNVFKPWDKVVCTCAPYEAMPQGILEIQLSDDIQSFEHSQYYPLRITKIQDFRATGNKDFAKREISILPVRTLPRDGNAVAARRERIRKEIARIESELERHGGSFEAWREEYKPVAEKYDQLCREGHAGWVRDSYYAAGGAESTYDTHAFIEGLLPYKRYLETNNIDLIVARVPSKWDFAARVLASEDFRENPAWVEHCYECLKNDIEIIDPMPEMWKQRFDYPLFYFYHDLPERHPCEGMAIVLAKQIADVLKRYPYPKTDPEIVLQDFRFKTDEQRFFWPGGNEKFDPSENLVFKRALQGGAPVNQFGYSSGSPFLFLSNSYFWFPQRPHGASVPAYTAYFMQVLPDWRYRGGVRNLMIPYLLEPHLLDFRRAVVMVGGFDAWNGIPSIPKYIQDGTRRISLEKTMRASSEEITIHDHESFSQDVSEDGAVRFKSNDNPPEQRADHFDMDFTIPGIEGKHTVMIRANIAISAECTVNLIDSGSGMVMDSIRVIPERVTTADFFLALSKPEIAVSLHFIPRNPQKGLYVKNIELWYY